MIKLRVKLLAYSTADEHIFNQGKERFFRLLAPECVEFVEDDPDILLFLSGGSERAAANVLKEGKFYTLLAFMENNSYAAATEVKAYYNQNGARSVLLDYDDRGTPYFIKNLYEVIKGLKRLRGQTLGLIGTFSDWLIASAIEPPLLESKLGILFKQIPWDSLPVYQEKKSAEDLLRTFQAHSPYPLEETGKVHTLLQECIQREKLDAVTVECFSLVTEHAVTACLSLAQFNANGFPAGCEGDLVSISGMMLSKEVTGVIPWIANTVKMRSNVLLFAHCTIASNLLSDYTVNTHFETEKGTAVQGRFAADTITVFRLNNTLDKAFISPGKVLSRPNYKDACRTQIEVRLPESAVQVLRHDPLGNHHLILPDDHTEKLSLTCHVLGIELQ